MNRFEKRFCRLLNSKEVRYSAVIIIEMKQCKYSYLVVPIGEDGEAAYKAIIPKFSNILIMADTLEELNGLVIEMIDEEIKRRKEHGEPIPEQDYQGHFNGKILVRVSPNLHEELYYQAQAHNLSLNKYIGIKLK